MRLAAFSLWLFYVPPLLLMSASIWITRATIGWTCMPLEWVLHKADALAVWWINDPEFEKILTPDETSTKE